MAFTFRPFSNFFKIILKPNKLLLPPRFVRLYGGGIGDIVQLTVPDGRVWRIGVQREEGNQFWLEKGLLEFVKQYSIHYGYFFTFNYNNHSNFTVNVYYETGSEIAYPPFNPPNIHSGIKGKRKVKLQQGDSSKKRKSEQQIIEVEYEAAEIILAKKINNTLSKVPQKTRTTINEACNSKPRNPSFLVIVLDIYIQNNNMVVPFEFTSKYMKNVHTEMRVEVRNGRGKWVIPCHYNTERNCLEFRRSGCARFYQENCLKHGDVCLFELVRKEPNNVFKVSIFRI